MEGRKEFALRKPVAGPKRKVACAKNGRKKKKGRPTPLGRKKRLAGQGRELVT